MTIAMPTAATPIGDWLVSASDPNASQNVVYMMSSSAPCDARSRPMRRAKTPDATHEAADGASCRVDAARPIFRVDAAAAARHRPPTATHHTTPARRPPRTDRRQHDDNGDVNRGGRREVGETRSGTRAGDCARGANAPPPGGSRAPRRSRMMRRGRVWWRVGAARRGHGMRTRMRSSRSLWSAPAPTRAGGGPPAHPQSCSHSSRLLPRPGAPPPPLPPGAGTWLSAESGGLVRSSHAASHGRMPWPTPIGSTTVTES